jgi:hypothetical protein
VWHGILAVANEAKDRFNANVVVADSLVFKVMKVLVREVKK